MANGSIKKIKYGKVIDNFTLNNTSYTVDLSNYPYSTVLIVGAISLYSAFISDHITAANAIVADPSITMTSSGDNELTFSSTNNRRLSVIVFDWP